MSSTSISADTWTYWNCTGTSTTSSYSTSSVWITWADATTTSCTTTTDDTWTTWSSDTTYRVVQIAPAEVSPEQRAEQARQAEEAAARRAEQDAARRAADAKAAELLRANLSQKQREALDKNGWFLVEGGRSKKQYRIHGTGRMEEMEGDAAVASFCVHADYTIPMPDQVLAKALCIRLDEDYIIRTANRTNLRRAA